MFAFKSEAALGEKIVAYLEDLQWEVYQEVPVCSGVADIVAVQAGIVWIVEVKRSLSLSVMAQAFARRQEAHLVSVAVPTAKWSEGRDYAMRTLQRDGVGVLLAGPCSVGCPYRAVLNRSAHKRAVAVRESLCEEHKTFSKAGAADGKRWTPFMRTCSAVLEIAKQRPGLSLKEIMDSVDHHYASEASARSSMSHWIQNGKVPGVVAKREGRFLRIYAEESTCEK